MKIEKKFWWKTENPKMEWKFKNGKKLKQITIDRVLEVLKEIVEIV